jgi:glycosyltransferase involved in cell wall biosynthesis
MNLLHLIDNFEKVNFGIWNAALFNSTELVGLGYTSFILIPKKFSDFKYPAVANLVFEKKSEIIKILDSANISPENTIVITHGCWQWPSNIGNKLKNKGFRWIATPHGMLEPWSLSQKKKRKKVFWNLLEKNRIQNADAIRAVGYPEYLNLKKKLNTKLQIEHISNCVDKVEIEAKNWDGPLQFLFMARINEKKGVIPLAKAWLNSALNNSDKYELLFAGPDDGLLSDLTETLEGSNNAKYIGSVYGEEKIELLKKSHFYVLPSFSEGFPTSVLEAMNYGLVALISEGCNFPDVFEKNLAIKVSPEMEDIQKGLSLVLMTTAKDLDQLSKAGHQYIKENYITEVISQQLNQFYCSKI